MQCPLVSRKTNVLSDCKVKIGFKEYKESYCLEYRCEVMNTRGTESLKGNLINKGKLCMLNS